MGGPPEICLGQKYSTAADQFDPNYNTPYQHRDLKKIHFFIKPQYTVTVVYGRAVLAKC